MKHVARLIVGVLGGLSGDVRREVEELKGMQKEVTRVQADIEEALKTCKDDNS